VLRVGVGFRVHGHRGDAQAARGADDAAGNFAAVGDQDLVEEHVFGHGFTRINADRAGV
jgi:hypothetical protein